jgi:hypothetical protein
VQEKHGQYGLQYGSQSYLFQEKILLKSLLVPEFHQPWWYSTSQSVCLLLYQHDCQFVDPKGQLIRSQIDSRAGKAKGKHSDWWNTTRVDGTQEPVDFSKVSSLEIDNSGNHTEDHTDHVFLAHTKRRDKKC